MIGILLLGFGITSVVVFPKRVTSLTTLQQPVEFLTPDKEVSDQLYDEWLLAKKRNVSFDPCSCVSYAKAKTGFSQVVGYAKNWPINSAYPTKGGVVVTAEGFYGHVAYITEVYEDSFKVTEANFTKCSVTTRTIQLTNSNIIGFYE